MVENTDRACCNDSSTSEVKTLAIIDSVDSGKTRKLLNACSQADGLFICAHPERVLDKCKAYDIKPVRSASFSQIPDITDKEDSIYIDDIDKLVKFLDTTYTKEEADSYLSNILLKTKEYTYSCDDNVSYIRKLMENN